MTTDPHPPDSNSEKMIWCRRYQRERPVAEHNLCLYCFGRQSEVESGDHEKFCDYNPDQDPKHFGFPEDNIRDLNG
jgi:hypothetical protein